MIDSEALHVTQQVTALLDTLDVPYVIGGSLASIAHGMIRATMDADIIADLQPHHVPVLLDMLSDQFYLPDESALRQVIERRGSFNMIHLTTMFKVDIFLPQRRSFDRQQLERRIGERVGSDSKEEIWILSAEDLVLAKLDWFRLGGESSERQWRDVLGVIKVQSSTLDIAYLREWARPLQVHDLLERAWLEATQAGC